MADDSDVIYIDVAPQLDEDAARKTSDKLKDVFKGAGKSIGEALNTELGQAVRARVEEIGNDYAKRLGQSIGTGIRDMAKDMGIDLGGIADKIQDVTGGIQTIGDAIDKIKQGNNAGALGDIANALKGIAGENAASTVLQNVADKAQPLEDRLNKMKGDLKATTDEFAVFTDGAPRIAGAFDAVGKAIGPVALALSAISALDKNFASNLENLFKGIDQGNMPQILRSGGGLAGDSLKDATTLFGLAPFPSLPGTEQSRKGTSTPRLDNPQNQGLNSMLLGGAGLSSWIQQGEAAAGVDASWTPGLLTLIGRESSGNPAAINNWDSNAAAGHPSQGLMQLIPGSFAANHVPGTSNSITDPVANIAAGIKYIQANYGGIGGVQQANPNLPPKGYAGGGMLPGGSPGYDNLIGNLGGSPVGLEGGEFVVNPGAAQANLGLLQAINGGMHFDSGGQLPFLPQLQKDLQSGPSGVQGQKPPGVQGQQPSGVQGQKPQGVQGQKPSGVMPSLSQPAQAPDVPSSPQTIIPQGEGKGFGISGGIIGGAEGAAAQAAAMGADAFTFGAGGGAASAVTQIAMQEANRAIEYGVKAGITLGVEAPLDTFWLSDSGLSDPSHSWFGKLGLNLIGKTGGAIQNLAGQTQAPLTPGQGQGSPLGGQQQKPGGPMVNIENQHNYSDTDHDANNRSLVNQMNAYSPAY